MLKRMPNVLWVLCLGFLIADVAGGQQPDSKKRVPVTLVLASTFPYDGNSIVMRELDPAPHDLIVLRESDASAQTLSDAVGDLIGIRRLSGDFPASNALLRTKISGGRVHRKLLPWSDRVLRDLRAAPLETVPNVGEARTIRIWLPKTPTAR